MYTFKSNFLVCIPCFLSLLAGCDSPVTLNDDLNQTEFESISEPIQPVTDSELQATLAEVRLNTKIYHDVEEAENDGYRQVSEFVPGMGYHYLKPSLLDASVNPNLPEALVYQDNPEDEESRKLGAVEYIIPFEIIDKNSRAALDGKFPGVDGDSWHKEEEIHSWTLHAWIWLANTEGVFHPTNPLVGKGS